MLTILSHRHLYNENGRDVVLAHIAVTTSAELPTIDGIDGFILHEGSKCWDITNSVQYGLTADGVWHEWESGTSIVTLKGRVDTVSDLPSNAQPGWMYFVGLTTDAELSEYVYTDSGNWEYIGANVITIDSALSSTSENPVQNKVVTNALNGKVDVIVGKGLSSEDYTTVEKTKVAGIEDGATKTIVDAELSGVSENPVQNKVVTNALNGKVDVIVGKGLSSEDYTTVEKTKVAGIEDGATKTIVDAELSGVSENPVQNKVVTNALFRNSVKHYGFRIDQNNSDSDTCVEYLYDAVGMTPAHMDFTNGVFDYGSWQDAWFIKDAYPVALRFDGTEDYKLDPNDYTKKLDGTPSDIYDSTYQGNFMMAFPRVWFKRYEVGTYNYIEVSNIQLDEDFKAYAHIDKDSVLKDRIYLPLFKGAVIDEKLRSIAGVTPSGFTTTHQETTAASACGEGWQIWDWSSREMICDLLALISKSINSQAKFGKGEENGYNSSDTQTYGKLTTGSLVDKGMFFGYSNSISEVKVFGIEGFWGNRWDRVLGLLLVDGVWQTKVSPPYNLTGSGYTAHGDFILPDNEYLKTTQSSEVGSIPKSTGGTASTYYADYFYRSASGICVSLCGGACSSGSGGGSRYTNVHATAASSLWNIGASPVKK